MGVINFAHGEFLMLGAYVVLTGMRAGLNLWVCMLLAPLVVGLVGLVIERLVVRYLYGRIIATMLATWGISLVLVQLVVIIFGPTTEGVGTPLGSFNIGNYAISEYNFVVIAVTAMLLLLMYLVLSRTRYGVEAQATTQIPEMASAIGINSGNIMTLTFVIGSALTGAAGAVLAPTVGVVPSMGSAFIARAFMAVVTGGQALFSGLIAAASALCLPQTVVALITQPFLGVGALLIVAIIVLRLMPRGLSAKWRTQL